MIVTCLLLIQPVRQRKSYNRMRSFKNKTQEYPFLKTLRFTTESFRKIRRKHTESELYRSALAKREQE